MVVSFKCELTGIVTNITYQPDKLLGFQSVEFEYPSEYIKEFKKNNGVSKEKQKYINPANGREISYARAKALKLIKK